MRLHLHTDRVRLYHGDAAAASTVIAPESVDAIVTDPPSGIGFMGKTWDSDKGGRDAWIAWLAGIMRTALLLLKPGGHALVWALPRTSHWTATAVEDAGFEVRDKVLHLFGTGFPKSLDVSKAIDEHLGADRPVVGKVALPNRNNREITMGDGWQDAPDRTGPGSPAAAQWSGWGTALKPAAEEWILARKPLSGTVASNVLAFGTGGINVDGCRVGTTKDVPHSPSTRNLADLNCGWGLKADPDVDGRNPNIGRWPAHLVLSHLPECEVTGEASESRPMLERANNYKAEPSGFTGGSRAIETQSVTRTVYRCAPGCAVAMLDEQSGTLMSGAGEKNTRRSDAGTGWRQGAPNDCEYAGDSGGASRFFATFRSDPSGCRFIYVSKATRVEKDAGLDHLPLRTGGEATDREDGSAGLSNPRAGAGRGGGVRNHHPTVKSIELMRWLCRLITPPGGTVLDLFTGSGTTGLAALREGLRFVGVEQDAAFVDVAAGRIAHVECVAPPPLADEKTERVEVVQPSLFGAA